ncbi:MAG: trehalase family glycosidase [Eubacteriales bacterium]
MDYFKNTHDLRLSDWGPYSKKYTGISHVANGEHGVRFDLSIFPAYYRRKVEVPNALGESNFHPWEASPDLSFFTTRHELEWKDQLYCDISYAKIDEDAYAIRTNCVNNSDTMQNIALHQMASIQYASLNAKTTGGYLYPVTYQIPEAATLVHAIDFEEFEHEITRATDSLIADGLRRGEKRVEGFYQGSAVALGEESGDRIRYTLPTLPKMEHPTLVLRYLNITKANVSLTIDGDMKGSISLPPCAHTFLYKTQSQADAPIGFTPDDCTGDISCVAIPITCLKEKDMTFYLSATDGVLLLDTLVFCEANSTDSVSMTLEKPNFIPTSWELNREETIAYKNGLPLDPTRLETDKNMVILKYEHSDFYYGIYWDYEDFDVRYILNDDLDILLKVNVQNHVSKILTGNNKGAFTNIFLRPIPLTAHTEKEIYGAVCCGASKEEVQAKLLAIIEKNKDLSSIYQARKADALTTAHNKNNHTYNFSQNLMIATTLTNVVYPVYTKRSYIKHNTPGTWWDSLYTWDSGFVGLGLSACDTNRALDCLNAYVTEPGDLETAFIHHGTPLPIQFYLFQEIYNKTNDDSLLTYFYPRLKQYYLFLVGELGSSDMAHLQSDLLSTWSYFYNSAGWDDYPAQAYIHNHHMEPTISCVSNTAHAIRCGKILKQMASLLCEHAETLTATTNPNVDTKWIINNDILKKDMTLYDTHIEKLQTAIHTHTWDEETGYFSYVNHDENGQPLHILRHETGENFNKGLDGTSPMIAGIVTPHQLEQITYHLMSKKHLLTDIGLSTVDQSAAYYRKDGYWNGSVWMPHQWFYFKSLLDYGNPDAAHTIAKIGLQLWEKEVGYSYNCFEHFLIASGRGSGWHQFSGLSTPVLLWHQSYFKVGTITCGFGGTITEQTWKDNHQIMKCNISFIDTMESTSIIAVMNPNMKYCVSINGMQTDFYERYDGVLEITIPVKSLGNVTIEIR